MNLSEKLDILAPAARFDACDTHSQAGKRFTPKKAAWDSAGIAAEGGPDGRAMPVLRLLMSNKCGT